VQPRGPYLLGGHSLGAYVAYEMARQLLERGEEVAHVMVLDTPAPDGNVQWGYADVDEIDAILAAAEIFERWFGTHLGMTRELLEQVPPAARAYFFQGRIESSGAARSGLGLDQIRGLINVWRVQSQIRYAPKPVRVPRITVLQASESRPRHAQAASGGSHPRQAGATSLGWEEFSAEAVEVRVVPGDHITMMTEPHVRVLADHVASSLGLAEAAQAPGRPLNPG